MVVATIVIFGRSQIFATTDVGQATIGGVTIVRAGSDATVTYSDGSTLTGNAAARQVLNNDRVIYQVNLSVARPGQLTLVATFPANNTVDDSSVSEAAGCQTGSGLGRATVDGQTSYTNNQATCVMEVAEGATHTTWDVSADVWGGNGVQVAPQFSVNGTASTVAVESVTTIGKPDYRLQMFGNVDIRTQNAGFNEGAYVGWWLYVPARSTGVLGIEPLKDGNFTIRLSDVTLPDYDVAYSDGGHFTSNQDSPYSVAFAGDMTPVVDGQTFTIKVSGAVTAVAKYPANDVDGKIANGYIYSSGRTWFKVPAKSLSNTIQTYSATINGAEAVTTSGPYHIEQVRDGASIERFDWPLSNKAQVDFVLAHGQYDNSESKSSYLPGWPNAWNVSAGYGIVQGSGFSTKNVLNRMFIAESDIATNVDYCYTWNAARMDLAEYDRTVVSDGDVVQFGVLGNNLDQLPSATSANCWSADNSQVFFDSLAAAQSYAAGRGLKVNTIRVHRDAVDITKYPEYVFGFSRFRAVGESNPDSQITEMVSVKSDQWDEYTTQAPIRIVPGLIRPELAIEPVSINPGAEAHLTVTPYVYGNDANPGLTITMPQGVTPKPGSFRCGDRVLIEGYDYTIAQSGDNNVVTIDLEKAWGDQASELPQDSSNVARPAVDFYVTVDGEVQAPTSLTVTVQATGDGTKYAYAPALATVQQNIEVAVLPKTFGWDLGASANSVYATDDLIYTYTVSNLMDDSVDNISLATVLPFNGDSRGTAGLNDSEQPYRVAWPLSLTDSDGQSVDGATVYYTTNQTARELETTDPGRLLDDPAISWQILDVNAAQPVDWLDVTAIKVVRPNLPSGGKMYLQITMDDIMTSDSGASHGVIGNDISCISYQVGDQQGVTTHQKVSKANYLGELLSLDLSRNVIETQIGANQVILGNLGNSDDGLTNVASVMTKSYQGYVLTMSAESDNGNLMGDDGRVISAKSAKPIAGESSWAVTLDGNNWQVVPGKSSQPLALYQTQAGQASNARVPTAYGVATDANVIAGNYSTRVIYTLTTVL